jgi:hypothetical protein
MIGSVDPNYCEGGTIEVTDAAATIVDATLAIGGKISGWVVDPLGYPDPDPSPQLDPDGGENDRVRPNGSYSISGLAPGSYCVTMPGFGSFVLEQTYDGALNCDSGATLVSVAAGEVTDQINFFKQTGGSISGTITRPAGPGEFTVEFHRLDAAQAVLSDETYPTGATTSEYGTELPPGTYCVLVRPHSSTGLANRAYGGTHSCAGAAPVIVPDITAVTDIDVTLTPQIFYALDNPARLVDTRPGRPVTEGAPQGTGPVAAGTVLEVQVGGLAGVPADAATAALNVTVAGAEGPGHLTLFPCGETVPTASNVNYVTGQTVPNAVIAKLGTDGKVCIFTFATTDIVVDVAGYFPTADGLIPLTNPARLIDTRPGRPVVEGAPAGTGPVAAKAVLEVQVGGLAGVPADAASAVLNVTAVAAQANGHLSVYPCGEELPTASNVNYVTNQTAPNSVIARLGTDGKVCIHTFSATDIVVDVAGYLPNADGLVPLVAPARLMDTRPDRPTIDGAAAGEGPIAGQTVRELQVGGRAGLPSGAASVVLNVTAAGAMANGHLTLFPCGEPAPTASNVNYLAGQTIPNAVIAKLGTDGKVCIRSHATTDVVVDVAGFLPAGDGPFIDPEMQD